MLHMWLIVLYLRQLCHIVCYIWLCAGTDLQCTGTGIVLKGIRTCIVWTISDGRRQTKMQLSPETDIRWRQSLLNPRPVTSSLWPTVTNTIDQNFNLSENWLGEACFCTATKPKFLLYLRLGNIRVQLLENKLFSSVETLIVRYQWLSQLFSITGSKSFFVMIITGTV
jgi:hypothetical protein